VSRKPGLLSTWSRYRSVNQSEQFLTRKWQRELDYRLGKDIVVLDPWAEDRAEGAVSSLARSRPVSVL
jgi:nuclear transport factor 2 (NTF2) superfamily protein